MESKEKETSSLLISAKWQNSGTFNTGTMKREQGSVLLGSQVTLWFGKAVTSDKLCLLRSKQNRT